MRYNNPALDEASDQIDPIETVAAGKRCAVNWVPWVGDWFVSSSPRNSSPNAEGPWDHWVNLALSILQDPLTAVVRPEAHAAVRQVEPHGFCSETSRPLTDGELAERFKDATPDV